MHSGDDNEDEEKEKEEMVCAVHLIYLRTWKACGVGPKISGMKTIAAAAPDSPVHHRWNDE